MASPGKRTAKGQQRESGRALAWLPPLVLLLGMSGMAVWGVRWLLDPHTLPLQGVHIEGDFRHLSRQTLERAVAAAARGGFFSLDVGAVRRAAEELPWVESATVRREWPRGLRMRVSERQPLARWGRGALVSVRGDLFFPTGGELPAGLPALEGPEGSARRVSEIFLRMRDTLRGRGLVLERLLLDARGAWRAELGGGMRLQLGSSEVEQRLARFVRCYPALMASRAGSLQDVDLRYVNGFATRWETPTPPGEQEPLHESVQAPRRDGPTGDASLRG